MIENIIAGIIVVVVVLIVGRSIYRTLTGKKGCSCSCGKGGSCDSSKGDDKRSCSCSGKYIINIKDKKKS